MSNDNNDNKTVKDHACDILKAGRESLEKFGPAKAVGADKFVEKIQKEVGCDKPTKQ